MEDAEFVGAKCLTISTALDCSRNYVRGESLRHLHWFSLGLLVTNRVSLEDECLPSFEVLNCLLNLAASFVDDENEIPLKEIASFSAVRFALTSIPLIVLHSLVISVLWSMFSTKSPHFFRLCSQMRFISFIRLLGVSLVVMEWQTFPGSRHLAKYCADSSSECSLTFYV